MGVKNKKSFWNDKEFILLAVIIIFAEKCFYLSIILNNVDLLIFQDIVLVLYFIFGVSIFIKYRNVKLPRCNFTIIVMFTIVLAVLSANQAFKLFKQPFLLGFRQQRYFMFHYLMYIPFNKFLYSKEENLQKVKSLICKIGTIEVLFYNLQYLIKGSIMLITVDTSIRYGGIRFHLESVLISLFFFLCMDELLKGNDIRKNTFRLSMILFYNFFVIRGRLVVIALLATSVMLVFLWRKNIFLKMSCILFGIIIFMGLTTLPMFNSYLSVLDSKTRAQDTNTIIRERGKSYLREQIKKSPILGRGVVNSLNPKACKEAGFDRKYFLNDNGLTGFTYMYGYLGVAWVAVLFAFIYFYSIKLYVKKKEYVFLGYITCLTLVVSNIVEFYWTYGPFYMGIFISMLETTARDKFYEDKRLENVQEKLINNEINEEI